jgi:hypothetical protein
MYRQLVWTTDNPAMPVVIHFPSPMSVADVQDLRDVVALWLRSLERQAFQEPALATEARSDETRSVSVEDEGAGPQGNAQGGA